MTDRGLRDTDRGALSSLGVFMNVFICSVETSEQQVLCNVDEVVLAANRQPITDAHLVRATFIELLIYPHYEEKKLKVQLVLDS